MDVVTLARLTATDADEQVAAKHARFAEKYPGAVTSKDDWPGWNRTPAGPTPEGYGS